ncbi:MAG TPA: YceI family protein [Candidatus Sulfotelmatobacter sp.]|nr:YceI family protein [Candidatus Sulfotelmatobacter sp.]
MENATGACVRYVVDTKASQFQVQAFASGLISAVAHSPRIAVRDWSGEAQFVPGTFNDAQLKVTVRSSSLEVLDELRDNDRREIHRVMNQEVLESPRYPEIRYQSKRVIAEKQNETLYRMKVEGNLSLHGMTNGLNLNFQLAMGVDSLRAYGDFLILQPDYGIKVASIAGATLKLRDELKFTFYVVARKQV